MENDPVATASCSVVEYSLVLALIEINFYCMCRLGRSDGGGRLPQYLLLRETIRRKSQN